jgi:hypothetical protein
MSHEVKKEDKRGQKSNKEKKHEQKNVSSNVIDKDKEISPEEKKNWMDNLYDVTSYTDEDLKNLYEIIKYQGFNRDRVLELLMRSVPEKKQALDLIIACALRGPRVASELQIIGGKSAVQIGILPNGGQGKDILTCNKIQAATADLAAFYLKKLNVPKRIQSDLPGWLQFPAAGSIKLTDNFRNLHKDFSIKFSTLIGGEFNESIYNSMVTNSYLDNKLNLF